jgi:hypothetical protein
LEPEDVKSQTLGAIWLFSKADGLLWKTVGAQRAGIKGLGASGMRAPNPYTNQSINQSINITCRTRLLTLIYCSHYYWSSANYLCVSIQLVWEVIISCLRC